MPRLQVKPGSLARMKPGEINLLGPFQVPRLAPRPIRIYLPKGYDPAKPHFGLYMFDGQNVFDDLPSFSGGWYIHEAVEALAKSKRPVPVVIGIEHGGPGRNLELSPFPFEAEAGQIEILLAWITGHLMPALTRELNLVPPPLGAVIGGSSMGGLAAFWSHFHHPESFGGALAMSPSFWVANQAIFVDVAAQPTPEVSRIYLDAGVREDKGKVVAAIQRMTEHLVERRPPRHPQRGVLAKKAAGGAAVHVSAGVDPRRTSPTSPRRGSWRGRNSRTSRRGWPRARTASAPGSGPSGGSRRPRNPPGRAGRRPDPCR